jgi:hypothetical protein
MGERPLQPAPWQIDRTTGYGALGGDVDERSPDAVLTSAYTIHEQAPIAFKISGVHGDHKLDEQSATVITSAAHEQGQSIFNLGFPSGVHGNHSDIMTGAES